MTIPSGTTAQRDGSPAVGMFRHNSTLNQFEGYNNGAWGAIGGGAGATGGGTDEVFFESDQLQQLLTLYLLEKMHILLALQLTQEQQ